MKLYKNLLLTYYAQTLSFLGLPPTFWATNNLELARVDSSPELQPASRPFFVLPDFLGF